MAEGRRMPVNGVRGRPMLQWVGKRPLDNVTAFPAQVVEQFNPAGEES